jgi:hypothetical protein
MPIGSTRAQWDEGLRTVRQFNDLLRVLPPVPQTAEAAGSQHSAGRRKAAPSRPLAPAGRESAPRSAAGAPPPARQEPTHRAPAEPGTAVRRPPPPGRNGHQANHYQR